MRRRSLSLIRVRTRPAQPTRGVLLAGAQAIPVGLGRGGIRANKYEGDGATPRGRPLSRGPVVVAARPPPATPDPAAHAAYHARPGVVRRYHRPPLQSPLPA